MRERLVTGRGGVAGASGRGNRALNGAANESALSPINERLIVSQSGNRP